MSSAIITLLNAHPCTRGQTSHFLEPEIHGLVFLYNIQFADCDILRLQKREMFVQVSADEQMAHCIDIDIETKNTKKLFLPACLLAVGNVFFFVL